MTSKNESDTSGIPLSSVCPYCGCKTKLGKINGKHVKLNEFLLFVQQIF